MNKSKCAAVHCPYYKVYDECYTGEYDVTLKGAMICSYEGDACCYRESEEELDDRER